MALFFSARQWVGEPTNREPDKCEGLAWFAVDRLPRNIVPYTESALAAIGQGKRFGLYGWPNQETSI